MKIILTALAVLCLSSWMCNVHALEPDREQATSCGLLIGGNSLRRGQSITSCNGSTKLEHQMDGNVVLRRNFDDYPLYNSGTQNEATTTLKMQSSDGNLVLYNGADVVKNWGTNGNRGAYLAIREDMNLLIYSSNSTILWESDTGDGSCGQLNPGDSLRRGQSITSCNGSTKLEHQMDGNVVLRRNFDDYPLYNSGTQNEATTTLKMQSSDGNLVLYNGADVVKNWGTNGNPGAYLSVEEDCTLAIKRNSTVLSNLSTKGCAHPQPSDVMDALYDCLVEGSQKEMTRQALHPSSYSGQFSFNGQDQLTRDKVDRIMDRAISHLNGHFNPSRRTRSESFLENTGAKYIHWAQTGWCFKYRQEDWNHWTQSIDRVHATPWGRDIVFEIGVMECVQEGKTNQTRMPDWLAQCTKDRGLDNYRIPSPYGRNYFSYEGMVPPSSQWPYRNHWSARQSVPDLTQLETQIYYAYVIAEAIDAGFEGIMLGQINLTGRNDGGNEVLYALSRFAKRWAARRAYRRAVFFTSHSFVEDYNGQPLFTHLTWPSRLRYDHGGGVDQPMVMGPDIPNTAYNNDRAREDMLGILAAPHDLPILFEIDNYGCHPGSKEAVNLAGHDEIGGYRSNTKDNRVAFITRYYEEAQIWPNAAGNSRAHLAPSGVRSGCGGQYTPYSEDGGEEETIRTLFSP